MRLLTLSTSLLRSLREHWVVVHTYQMERYPGLGQSLLETCLYSYVPLYHSTFLLLLFYILLVLVTYLWLLEIGTLVTELLKVISLAIWYISF